MAKRAMYTWNVFWSPTGQKIATVQASTAKAAKSKAPAQYRKYKGEMYVEKVESNTGLMKKLRKGIRGHIKLSRGRLIIKT